MTTHLQDQPKQSTQTNKYRSPKRVLVAFFENSRDKWKQKYRDIKTELKRLKVRVYDVTKSRDQWKQKSQEQQQQLKKLQTQIQKLQSQTSHSKKRQKRS